MNASILTITGVIVSMNGYGAEIFCGVGCAALPMALRGPQIDSKAIAPAIGVLGVVRWRLAITGRDRS